MKRIILLAFLAMSLSSYAQLGGLLNKAKGKGKLELYPEEKLDFPQYQNNIGKVCFSSEEFERTLPENKYIKTYNLGDKLAIRAWMANSPANSMLLQLEESGKKPRDINDNRDSFSYQSKVLFVIYFDGQRIANTSYGQTFKEADMTSLPTHRADLNDATDQDYFGEDLYRAILKRQDLLTAGNHKLKIELVPFKTAGFGSDFTYKPIAVGEIDVIVPKEIKVTEADCFPKKAMSDPKLEAECMKAMKRFFKDGAPYAFKVILHQSDIKIMRQEYTGVILRKKFNANIVFKKGDEVWYDWFTFHKEYDGSKYEEATVYGDPTASTLEGKKVNKECLKLLK